MAAAAWGKDVRVVARTASTNDDLKALALAGAAEGTVVRAVEQAAGRGRAGRLWASPPGGLWCSVLLRPTFPAAEWGILPLVAGVAIAEAAERFGARALVKWPNDVLAEDAGGTWRKLAGVLCESVTGSDGFVVVGCGVNVAVPSEALPAEVQQQAVSLDAIATDAVDAEAFLTVLLEQLQESYDALGAAGTDAFLETYATRSATLQRHVRLPDGTSGQAVAVARTGALVVATRDGRREVAAGDVTVHQSGG